MTAAYIIDGPYDDAGRPYHGMHRKLRLWRTLKSPAVRRKRNAWARKLLQQRRPLRGSAFTLRERCAVRNMWRGWRLREHK